MRSTRVLVGACGLLAVLVAAPVEFTGDPVPVGPNLAAAKPGGGNGNGHGRGKGHGAAGGQPSDLHGVARGHAKDGQSAGADGRANGQANGHAPKDAVSGVEHAPPGHAKKEGYVGVKGNLGVQGSFNAIHSAAINKGVVAEQSRVARVEAYLGEAQNVSNIEKENGDLEAAIEAAALAAASASSQTVTEDMLDRVHAYSNAHSLTHPGIEMSPETTEDVADQAQDIQSGS